MTSKTSSPALLPVLLVDDRVENLIALEETLQDMGLEIVRAQSGNEALRVLLHREFAVVLMDVQMPEMDGFETAELIRGNAKTKLIPIIFITAGMTKINHRFKGYEIGAVDYITKPIDAVIVRAKVKIFCELFQRKRDLERREQALEEVVRQRTAQLTEKLEQHRKDQVAIEESERRFRSLFEGAPIGMYRSTQEGRILQVNKAFVNLLGFSSPEEMLQEVNSAQTTVNLWRASGDRSVFIEKVKAAAEGNKDKYLHRQIQLQRKGGGIAHAILYMAQSSDRSTDAPYFIGFVDDITELKLTQEQLLQAQKMESLGRLAGGVAHDFNNMLGVILASTELALMETVPKQMRGLLDSIYGAAKKSQGITNQLLAFSRKRSSEPRAVELGAMIEESSKILERLVGESIRLEVIAPAGVWPVKIEFSHLDQILMNLSVNARDAMPSGGTLKIEVRNVQVGEELLARNSDVHAGEYVRLTISDTGTGMDEKTQKRIFEPFFTTKEEGKGTGLGLATVFGIVKQSGGFIQVKSELGKGTAFNLHFPRYQASVEKVRAQAQELRKGNECVLLVEDEELMLWTTAQILEKLGYTVVNAATPDAAIEIFRKGEQKIDVVLTDIIMPGMTGKEMMEKVLEIQPNIRVIYMSGYAADSIVDRKTQSDNEAYLHKPFSMAQLSDGIRGVLNASATHK